MAVIDFGYNKNTLEKIDLDKISKIRKNIILLYKNGEISEKTFFELIKMLLVISIEVRMYKKSQTSSYFKRINSPFSLSGV